MSATTLAKLNTGMATDAGRKRRGDPNQDAIQFVPAGDGRPPLFIVADGMGGHAGGAVASQLVISAIESSYRSAKDFSDLTLLLGTCIQQAHKALAEHAALHPELAAMGSTVVLAVIQDGKVFVANVGDSRAYLIRGVSAAEDASTITMKRVKRTTGVFGAIRRLFSRKKKSIVDGSGKPFDTDIEVRQISFDHSEVADMVRSGTLTPLQALRSPRKNRLTQSLSPRRREITPHIKQFPFTEKDILLLCTDGLWGVIPEATMAAIALELMPQVAADKLVQQAVSYGGPDNVSVVIARWQGDSKVEKDDDTRPGL